jgi:peptide/nickel transport system permease protein
VTTRASTHTRTALRYLGASRRAKLGAGILATLALVCGVGSLVVPLPSATARAPTPTAHWLGTDERGRDVLALILHGGTTVLGTAVLAVLAATLLGALVGAIYALAGPRHNRGLDRWLEAVDTFPAIVVVALFRAIQEHPSNLPVVAAVAIVKWAEVARIVRAEALRLATEDFVLAARALGATRLSIATRHVLPHVASALSVSASLGVASVVLLDTAVSFLGLGPRSDAPSWGGLLADGLRGGHVGPLIYAPLALTAVTVAAAYLVADAFRDAIDPTAVRLPKPAR